MLSCEVFPNFTNFKPDLELLNFRNVLACEDWVIVALECRSIPMNCSITSLTGHINIKDALSHWRQWSSVFWCGCGPAWEQQRDGPGPLFGNHTGPPQPFLKQRQHISKASSLIHRLHPDRVGFCACVFTCVCVCVCVRANTNWARGGGMVTTAVKK